MNISYRWLLSLAPGISGSPRELADRLGLLGAPVDELVEIAEGIGDVVIARVEEVRPHPNADRLRVCTVNTGGDGTLQVVCGAPNVEAGGYYPFAPIGASLPGGMEIRRAKLRGEVSEGMLCSARELGLGRDHAGLLALSGEWSLGDSFVAQLGLEDARLLVDITPNRPDLLSHIGIARELAPGGVAGIELRPFGDAAPRLELAEAASDGEAAGGVRVRIEDAEGCPRYLAAVIRGVRVGPSPEWLATRLRVIGQRPINNVVDATNYVLHELGQPLHAFDLARLGGGEIRVRRSRQGETLRTLDGADRTLAEGMLVIADAERPVALAGVMGGEESEVTAETSEVLLECALFDERLVRRTARGLGLSTDASYRFERGVDPELQPLALRRLVDLIVAVAGGEADPRGVDVRPAPHARPVLEVRPERVRRLLGVPIAAAEIRELLEPIGFGVEESGGTLRVTVPGFRPDVTREIDVVEEVARRRGYDSFPEALPGFRPSAVPEDPQVETVRRLHALLGGWGVLEARTVAFAPSSEARVPLLNPLSAEESHLRDALGPGLLRRLEHNWSHGVRDVRLYEIGSVFFPAPEGERPREEVRVAVLLTGARRPQHWSEERAPWDVWDARALFEELARELGTGAVVPGGAPHPLEPAESFSTGGNVAIGGAPAGWGGRVAERAMDAPAWAEPVWLLELTVPAERPHAAGVRYTAIPEFPGSERDLALLVPDAVAAAEVERVIRGSAGELLHAVFPFDRYAGKGIPEGTTSLAWRMRFRHPERTLTDAEVDGAVTRVLQALEGELDVRRR
jgi:phenylalanyl-tRNA synthetase beta chain